ncbi:MAG: small ribosomal subunit biogenesis GTPase RsgA [Gammaproteobacteria bacterium]|nr:small ribosomal subunit biogenesis GTPase RsgA [Gammaproteobacteria bacterium]MCW8841660.1 small ribosomal subunit biogenesis GTPase RsgA [Gammaproteobacteria bacterium]MCW8928231.1 small ribosomal subunit biogenesis GTPase RsgA [Gammaproteobacteria bacterium]MCW8957435.1 small ribosomal subunit biogenesis GTPase RsgA [Gammaproteobacteria bacterium]MCW8974040.1 small ribosomal subunit biogenesis GTPase RsgA [Gammaproteobacteria bacterium]
MAKRKLNRRQQWRIDKIQQERRQRAERRQTGVSEDAINALGPEEDGVVVANFGASVEIEDREGKVLRCLLRQNLPQLVVGDRVVWQRADESGVVIAMQPRRSELARPDAAGNLRPVAANIDQILVVAAPAPAYSPEMIDQYLAAAELTGIAPVLVFNKIDLVDDNNRKAVDKLLSSYHKLGYTVLSASTKVSHGMDELLARLKGKTSVFVGQSGVGKSSLVQSLLPQQQIGVGELSTQSGLGQHTTSTSRLYHLPGGGEIIDSPGVREFRLWQMEPSELIRGFREFASYLGQCKFRDCTHEHEPGCALREAVERGDIEARRLASFRRIAAQQSQYETNY